MINDIVVNLSVRAKANSASDYAISLAAALDAHLTGIIFLYGPTMPVSRAGYVPPELEVIERHNEAAVEATRESFTAASTRAGIKAESLTVSASLVSAGDQFGQIARRFDLAVVGQAEPETKTVEENIIEAALFDSGGRSSSFPTFSKRRSSWTTLWYAGTVAGWRRGRSAMPCRFCAEPAGSRSSSYQRAQQTGSNRACRYRRAFGSPRAQRSDQADAAWRCRRCRLATLTCG